jgi:hypothetical protein
MYKSEKRTRGSENKQGNGQQQDNRKENNEVERCFTSDSLI